MDYGPYSALVEEVIAAIPSGGILRPIVNVDAPNALVLTDLEEATRYAWSRSIGGHTWTSLREVQTAPFHAEPYKHPERKPAYDAVDGQLEPLFEVMFEKLPREYRRLFDDIAGDLEHCALNRALHGLVPDSFWERVWQVYRQGAWPCGWDGEYPAGRMVIYQPSLVP
jgi:hypothetical protein